MTTQEAFKELISEARWYLKVGITIHNACMNNKRFKEGTLSETQMERLLTKADYAVVQNKVWKKN